MTTGDGIKYIDLFGGIGGFRLGIEQATHKEWKCLWYNDFNKYSVKIYNKNFKEKYEPKDIKEVDAKDIPRHDLICAGFPCQSFSIAGKRKGFEDTRGTLFFEICRIARFHKPKYLFLENVKGLLSHNKGETFKTILESLWKLGYDVEWQLLNSKNHGVPHNRERIFIIGHLGGFCGKQIFPIRKRNKLYKEKNRKKEFGSKDITAPLNTRCGGLRNFGNTHIKEIIYDDYNNKIKYNGIVPSVRQTNASNASRNASKVLMFNQHWLRTCEYGDGFSEHAFTLDSCCGRDQLLNGIRKLTPIECERLQGFPDNWTNGISDTQRYKALGNAVTVNVIHDIIEKWCQKGDT